MSDTKIQGEESGADTSSNYVVDTIQLTNTGLTPDVTLTKKDKNAQPISADNISIVCDTYGVGLPQHRDDEILSSLGTTTTDTIDLFSTNIGQLSESATTQVDVSCATTLGSLPNGTSQGKLDVHVSGLPEVFVTDTSSPFLDPSSEMMITIQGADLFSSYGIKNYLPDNFDLFLKGTTQLELDFDPVIIDKTLLETKIFPKQVDEAATIVEEASKENLSQKEKLSVANEIINAMVPNIRKMSEANDCVTRILLFHEKLKEILEQIRQQLLLVEKEKKEDKKEEDSTTSQNFCYKDEEVKKVLQSLKILKNIKDIDKFIQEIINSLPKNDQGFLGPTILPYLAKLDEAERKEKAKEADKA